MGLDFITAMGGDESTAKVGAMGNVDIDTQEKAMRGKRKWEGCVSFAFFRVSSVALIFRRSSSLADCCDGNG